MSNKLFEKIYGCMMGGAVGDAMGFPTEGYHYEFIRAKWGKIEKPMAREGAEEWNPPVRGPVYTDDTVMKHMVCEAIFESGGRPTIEAVAAVWRHRIQDLEQWIWWANTRVVAAKSKWNPLLSLREIGRDSIPCDDAAMIIGPIGIINAGDPARAATEALDISSLWQTGYSRECAGAMAACHAEALRPNATVESIVETARHFCPALKPHLDKALELAMKHPDPDEFTERYYRECLNFPNSEFWCPQEACAQGRSFGADPLEVCTEALTFLTLAKGEARKAILGAINFGRDCDTIAGIAGALCGALNGFATIPPEWVAAIEQANPSPDIRDYSERLYRVLINNLDSLAKQVEEMRLLDE